MRTRRFLPLLFLLVTTPLTSQEAEPEERLGAPANWSLGETGTRVTLDVGSELRRSPDSEADRLVVLPGGEVEVLESRGTWVRIVHLDDVGWVDLEASPTRVAEDLVTVEKVFEKAAVDAREAVDRARNLLGPEAQEIPLGPFTLHTDVTNPRLLEALRNVGQEIVPTYTERYGLPAEEIQGTVVLFADEKAYREFSGSEDLDFDLDFSGHATGNGAFFYLRNNPKVVLRTLLHELTHVLNSQVLGRQHPLWLEEGLAGDLAISGLDRRGHLDPSVAQWLEAGLGERDLPFLWGQVLGSLRVDEGLTLKELVVLESRDFLGGRADLYYLASMMWIRFLLKDRELAAGFRAYLQDLLRTEAAPGRDPDVLEEALGQSWDDLEEDFKQWAYLLALRFEAGVR